MRNILVLSKGDIYGAGHYDDGMVNGGMNFVIDRYKYSEGQSRHIQKLGIIAKEIQDSIAEYVKGNTKSNIINIVTERNICIGQYSFYKELKKKIEEINQGVSYGEPGYVKARDIVENYFNEIFESVMSKRVNKNNELSYQEEEYEYYRKFYKIANCIPENIRINFIDALNEEDVRRRFHGYKARTQIKDDSSKDFINIVSAISSVYDNLTEDIVIDVAMTA